MRSLAIDLGGSRVKLGVVEDGRVLCATVLEAHADAGLVPLLPRLEAACGPWLATMRPEAVGIAFPSLVDVDRRRILGHNAKFADYARVDLTAWCRDRLGLPLCMDNDANAAALGEAYAGAAKGCRDAIMVTLGTGVGGGIIIDRKIYSGFNSNGAELGHTVIVADGRPCTCGRHGCWEAYASVTGLIADTRAAMLAHPESSMWQLEDGSVENVSGKTAFIAAKAGDPVAEEVVRKYREYVAIGITNLVNIFQPEVLCVGGAISKEGEYLLAPIREFVERERYTRYCKQTEIKIASLGNDAGIIGAAMLGKSV
ncbi:MAG: ROK family protein [Eubacteriales bacterium]